MDKKELIALMVKNYYGQVEIVGTTTLTLEDYLRGIMFGGYEKSDESKPWTEADLTYGLGLNVTK